MSSGIMAYALPEKPCFSTFAQYHARSRPVYRAEACNLRSRVKVSFLAASQKAQERPGYVTLCLI